MKRFCCSAGVSARIWILRTEVAADVRGVAQAGSAGARSRRRAAPRPAAARLRGLRHLRARHPGQRRGRRRHLRRRLRQNGTVQARRDERECANEHEPHLPGARIVGSRHHRSHLLRVADGCPARMPEYFQNRCRLCGCRGPCKTRPAAAGFRVPGSKVPRVLILVLGPSNLEPVEPWNPGTLIYSAPTPR